MWNRIVALGSLCLVFLMPMTSVSADEEANQLQALLTKQAPTIVTVKAVVKMEAGGGGRDTEVRIEMQGAVVSPDGMVMISNALFSLDKVLASLTGQTPPNMKITLVSAKVVVEREEKEYEAFLAAKDINLDLAFLKIEDLGDRKLLAVDFTAAATPTLGQKLVLVSRLDKGYDYAPFFASIRISGEIVKPRKAWSLDGGNPDAGLPIFTTSGELVGALTNVMGNLKGENAQDSMGFSYLMRMVNGNGGLTKRFVIPASTVQNSIVQAQSKAIEVAAERAKNKTAKPTAPTKAETKP